MRIAIPKVSIYNPEKPGERIKAGNLMVVTESVARFRNPQPGRFEEVIGRDYTYVHIYRYNTREFSQWS